MKTTRFLLFCGAAALTMHCAPPAPMVDVDAEKAAVLQADSAWSAAAQTLDGHLNAFAEDAVVMVANEPLVSGKAAISGMLREFHDMPGFVVQWQANSAEVAASGDLAYTLGYYRFAVRDTTGQPISDQGKYVTVWKKQNGEWKVAVDAFSSDLPQK